jgi:hypothetical protein
MSEAEAAERRARALAAPALLIGHSHVHAPVETIRDHALALDAIAFWVEPGALENTTSGLHFRADLAERIAVARPIYSFIGGNAHTVLGLVEHHRPFDFVLPEEPALPLDPARELVTVDAVRASLAAIDVQYIPILELLLREAGGPVVQVGPPPPVFVADEKREKYPWSMTPDRPRAFAPPWVRYKIWRLSTALIEARCRALQLPFVAAPAEALDANGFLRDDLRKDVAHANGRYGALVLRALGLAP